MRALCKYKKNNHKLGYVKDLEDKLAEQMDCSEKRLVIAVILQAIQDTQHTDKLVSKDAEKFLLGKTGVLQNYCKLVDLNDKAIISTAKEKGFNKIFEILKKGLQNA